MSNSNNNPRFKKKEKLRYEAGKIKRTYNEKSNNNGSTINGNDVYVVLFFFFNALITLCSFVINKHFQQYMI